jgi:hypothetical protein
MDNERSLIDDYMLILPHEALLHALKPLLDKLGLDYRNRDEVARRLLPHFKTKTQKQLILKYLEDCYGN